MKNLETQQAETAFSNDPIGPLNAMHSSLLQRHRQEGETVTLLNDVEAFIFEGRAAGTMLTREADRWEIQGILDFWVAILHRAGRVPPDATLAELNEDCAPKFHDDECPYLGLTTFGEMDETRFFGRQQLLNELMAKLTKHTLVAIVGPSGSGASSLIFAGLIPLLKKGEALPGSEQWHRYPTIVPGSNPLFSLVRSLLSNPGADSEDFTARINQQVALLKADPAHIISLLQGAADGKPAMLVIDQFEETFTLCTEEIGRNAFIDALSVLLQHPTLEIKLILTMREAYRGRITRLQNATFKQCFDRGLLLVRPPEDNELRAMIEQPARAIGLNFEHEVVDELIADIRGEPAATYLLQDTLVRLWALREYNWITIDAYRKLGGAKYALVQGARQVYSALSPKEKKIAKALLLRLVHVGIDREAVSRRVLRTELLQNHQYTAYDADRVLKTLTNGRVVRQSRGDRDADTQVELMHDALIQNWPELRTWLWDSWDELRQRQRLTDNARLWEESGHSAHLLLQGGHLDDAQSLTDLNPLEEKYVHASIVARQLATQRQQRIYWGVIAALASVLFFVSLLALVAWNAQQEAVQAQNTAKVRLASLLSSEAARTMTSKPQRSLLLALEAVATSPQTKGTPVVTETLQTLQQALSTTTSYPLRGLDMHVITNVVRIATSLDGKWLAAGSQSGMLHLWNLTAGEPDAPQVSLHLHNSAVTALTFSPDGHWLSTGGQDAVINIFDLTATNVVSSKLMIDASGDAVTALAFYPTTDPAKTWLAVGHTDSVVQRIDLPTADPPRVSALLGEPSRATKALAFSSDSKWLATVDITDTLRVWPLATTALPSVSPLLSKDKNDVLAFSPDGQWLATASTNGTTIYLYKLEDLDTPPFPLLGSATGEQAIGFSPDGRLLATGGRDGIVRLWSLDSLSKPETKTTVQVGAVPSSAPTIPTRPSESSKTTITPIELPQRPGAVSALVFGIIDKGDAGGMWLLATASADPIVELWNIDDLTAPWSLLYGHDVAVKSVSIAEQFSLVFAESQDGTIRTWNLVAQRHAPKDLNQLMNELPMWVTEACQRAGREFSASEWAEYFGDLPVKPTCADEKITSGQ